MERPYMFLVVAMWFINLKSTVNSPVRRKNKRAKVIIMELQPFLSMSLLVPLPSMT
jgi:hypothetical protein